MLIFLDTGQVLSPDKKVILLISVKLLFCHFFSPWRPVKPQKFINKYSNVPKFKTLKCQTEKLRLCQKVKTAFSSSTNLLGILMSQLNCIRALLLASISSSPGRASVHIGVTTFTLSLSERGLEVC